MKKLISISASIAMVALLAGPMVALGGVDPSPTPLGINTGLTRDTTGGATPIVKVKWEANADKYTDDKTTAGAQFNPSGQYQVNKTIALCAIVTDPDGLADITTAPGAVYGDVFYPVGVDLGDSHVALKDQSNLGCGQLMQEDKLTKLSKADGIDLFCNKVKNLNNNLPTFNDGYTYDEICKADGELQKETAGVFCGTKDLSYEDPSGDYAVWAVAQDKVGLQGKLINKFTYQPVTAFETDFNTISYGPVRLATHKIISGDLTWDALNAGGASVRNIGNTRLSMKILQDDMGFGQTGSTWNVKYDGRVGSDAVWKNYWPEALTKLNDPLDLSELNEMDFSIDVSKFPPTHESDSFTGAMTLSAVKEDHLSCGTTLTVNKVLSPSNDPGKFNLQINGTTAGTGVNVGNGGTTGAITETAGAYTVGETAGTATSLADYNTVIGGDCASNGSVTLAVGDQKTCIITNTLKTTTLTVTKALSPTDDPGKFNLQIDSVTQVTNVGNGGTTGAITVSAGPHTVGELAGTGTNLGDYTTVIGGQCASNGSITLAVGENKTCTITNTRKGGTLTVHKDVNNNEIGTLNAGNFQLTIDGNPVAQDTPIPVPVGLHTVSEVDSQGYTKTVGVDCAANGTVTVGSNENKHCTVTNTFPFFTVTVNKVVINNSGGNNVLADFHLFVGSTEVTSGAATKVAVGTYLISESGVGGYNAVFSGDCNPSTQLLTGANGDNKTCTITNTDIEPNITLIKHVDSGSALPTDFVMRIDGGAPVPSGSSRLVTSNAAHTIDEDAKANYHFVSITGDAKCPAGLGGTVTLNEGEAITCTIHNAINP